MGKLSFVSVIIPCYKQAQFLGEAIRSALAQDYLAKEIIVVNDGSPDATRDVASAFGNSIVYVEQENRGLSGARNSGIRAARGDYVALLDSDDVYLPGCLSVQARVLDAHPEAAMVCGDAWLFDEKGCHGLKSGRSGRPQDPSNFRWETVSYCPTPSTVMLRRQCLCRTGLFDENLRNAAEDWLMWVRLSLHFDMIYLDQPLIRYRLHAMSATRNVLQISAGNRYAVAKVVDSLDFAQYPAHFRAKLLYFRFATAWRVEPKAVALRYFWRAFFTDPLQLPYGLRVLRQGVVNTLRRLGKR